MRQKLRLAVALAVTMIGCGDDGTGGAGATGGAGGRVAACELDVDVAPASFVDRTAAWGLGALTGPSASQAIAAADIDGDGYPDLLVHGFGERMPVEGGDRFIRVLLNREVEGGGRTFVDATDGSGYPGISDDDPSSFRSAHTAAFGDVDNDGDLDVVSATFNSPSADPNAPSYADRTRVLLNDGTGVFTYAAPSEISPEGVAAVASVTLVDVDLDGALDVFESVWFTPSGGSSRQPIMMGAGDGTFTDETSALGVAGVDFRRPGFGSTACDLDGNGWPELLTQSYGRKPNMLLRLTESGFVDDAVEASYAYDDNVDVSDDQVFLCWCADNVGDERCEGAAAPMVQCGVGLPVWSWGTSDEPENLGGNTFSTACGDVNGDGRLDLFTGEIAHWWAGAASDKTSLLLQTGDDPLRFERPSREEIGIDWTHEGPSWDEGGLYTTLADFDNDGRMDLVVGASDYSDQYLMLFHQRADGTFEERAAISGIDHACASSPVVADFDRDGDLDLVVGASLWREFCTEAWGGDAETPAQPEVRLYENDASDRAHGVAVRLVGDGVTTNRAAIGARVTLRAGDLEIVREVDGGHGHSAMQDDTVVFFGLNACTTIDSIEVRWPNLAGDADRVENPEPARLLEISQGSDVAVVVVP